MKLFAYIIIAFLIAFSYPKSVSCTQSSGEFGALLANLNLNNHRAQTVAFSPDGMLLAAGYGFFGDGGITIWNTTEHSIVASPSIGNSEKEGIKRIAFSGDGKLFAAASDLGTVMLWNVSYWKSYKIILEPESESDTNSLENEITDIVFSPDSTTLAFSSNSAVTLYDLKTGKITNVLSDKKQDNSFTGISFSPNGQSLVICRRESVQIWDIKNKKQTRTWKSESYNFFGHLSPEGKHIILGGGSVFGEKLVEIWSYPEGQKIKDISGIENGLFSSAISNSGKIFAVAGGIYGGGGSLSLWTIDDTHELGFVSFGDMPIQGVAFNQDDTILAAASESGSVLLYSVDKIHGPEVKKQDFALCGEIAVEGNSTYIMPISKVPRSVDFDFAWKLEIVNPDAVTRAEGLPVILENWAIESNATGNRARILEFQLLLSKPTIDVASNYIIFGDVQNPGWNQGCIAKIYGDGSFVATTNFGRCLAYGNLDQLKTDFQSVKKRLIEENLLLVPKEPLTLRTAHYRTRFIGIASNGVYELRSDADSLEVLLNGGLSKKREAFTLILDKEQPFLNLLQQVGIKLLSKRLND